MTGLSASSTRSRTEQLEVDMPSDGETKASVAISVVVPAFNEANYLGPTVDAIRTSQAQLPPEVAESVELVVVDDRSTDSTRAVAAGLVDQVVAGPRMGIGAARNAGALMACGDTLVFIDADARVEPGVLPAIHEAIAAGAVGGAIRPTYWSPRRSIQVLLRFWDWYAPRRDITQGVCQFFDRSLFFALDGYRSDLLMAEDTDLYHRALARCGEQAVYMVQGPAVHPSMRRYEQSSVARLWWQMNPVSTRLFRRSARLWKDWYVNPPR